MQQRDVTGFTTCWALEVISHQVQQRHLTYPLQRQHAYIIFLFVAMFTLVRCSYVVNRSHYINNATRQTRKICVRQGVEKSNNVKIKRFSVDSTVDNELADEKLPTLHEVAVANRCLGEPFWLPFFLYMLGDPIIFSANFIDISAPSERFKLGKNGRCLHYIFSTPKKSSNVCISLCSPSKIAQAWLNFLENLVW
jgi:hypothetical protein